MTNDAERERYSVLVPEGKPGKFLAALIEQLNSRVFGQDRAIRRAVRILARFYTGMNDSERPVGIMLFAGPTGVGKSYLAKELGYAWVGDAMPEFGTPVIFIRCETLGERHEVLNLRGAPPSYVGYGDPSPLEEIGRYDLLRRTSRYVEQAERELAAMFGEREINALKQLGIYDDFLSLIRLKTAAVLVPFRSVVIFDEYEKADRALSNFLLGIFETGKLRLPRGITIDFTGTLFALTTNVGSQELVGLIEENNRPFAFAIPKKEKSRRLDVHNQEIWARVHSIIKGHPHFPPEFLNRIGKDGLIVFDLLSDESYEKILEKELKSVQGNLDGRPGTPVAITLAYSPACKKFLLAEGVDRKYGARPLRSAVEKYVRFPLGLRAENGSLRSGDEVFIDVEYAPSGEGKPVIYRRPRPSGRELPEWKLRTQDAPELDIKKIIEQSLFDLGVRIDGGPLPGGQKKPNKPKPANPLP